MITGAARRGKLIGGGFNAETRHGGQAQRERRILGVDYVCCCAQVSFGHKAAS